MKKLSITTVYATADATAEAVKGYMISNAAVLADYKRVAVIDCAPPDLIEALLPHYEVRFSPSPRRGGSMATALGVGVEPADLTLTVEQDVVLDAENLTAAEDAFLRNAGWARSLGFELVNEGGEREYPSTYDIRRAALVEDDEGAFPAALYARTHRGHHYNTFCCTLWGPDTLTKVDWSVLPPLIWTDRDACKQIADDGFFIYAGARAVHHPHTGRADLDAGMPKPPRRRRAAARPANLDQWVPHVGLEFTAGQVPERTTGALPLLSWLCWATGATSAIEIGVGGGYVTCALAASLMRPRKGSAKLLAVDKDKGKLDRLLGTMKQFDDLEWFPVHGYSHVVLPKRAKKHGMDSVGLIVIDGDARPRSVSRDIGRAAELLAPDGVLLLRNTDSSVTIDAEVWSTWTAPAPKGDSAYRILRRA